MPVVLTEKGPPVRVVGADKSPYETSNGLVGASKAVPRIAAESARLGQDDQRAGHPTGLNRSRR